MNLVKANSPNVGFGFKRDETGKLIRNEHSFDVFLNEDVEIGRFTNIDRGSWRDTVIGKGTKIDSLVHIGHNAIIGEHCLLVAGCVIGGSVEIGDYSHIGMNASIKDHVSIGKHCIVGAGAVVIRDVKDYSVMVGNPAKSIKDNLTDEQRFRMIGHV